MTILRLLVVLVFYELLAYKSLYDRMNLSGVVEMFTRVPFALFVCLFLYSARI